MREKEYSEWMSKQGFNVLRHANCCKIAFNGGWESRHTEVDELQKRLDALTLALDQIAYPIPHMQKEAELNGCELNGYWAVKMSEDHTYSKDIARRALEKEQALKGGSND